MSFKFDDTLTTFVRLDIKQNNTPMLVGEPGIGKSSWVEALAKSMHTVCFTLACNQLADKADLTGARLVPVENSPGQYKQMFFPHAVVADAIQYAKDNPRETPILFLDEINRTTPDVTSEALSLSTLREIGSSKLPSNLKIIIAGNDKGNVTTLDEASISRFTLYPVLPDVNTFLSVNPKLNQFCRAVLQANPSLIFCKTMPTKSEDDDENEKELDFDAELDSGESMKQFTTPRTITNLSSWLNELTQKDITAALAQTYIDEDGTETNVMRDAVIAHVGNTEFALMLMGEIAKNIMSASVSPTNAVNVGKPNCYDDMKKQTTREDLNAFIDSMTPSERSGCLVYALYESEDNELVLNALTPKTTSLEPEDMRTLMLLATSQNIDQENAHAFLSINEPITTQLSAILSTV